MSLDRDGDPKVSTVYRAGKDLLRRYPSVDVCKDFLDISLDDAEVSRFLGYLFFDVFVDVSCKF
mgnify:CR=1 FL=1